MALPSEAATRELFAAYWRTRSIADRNAIVAAWEPLIWILMAKRSLRWNNFCDPYSYGAEGLIEAVEKYDGRTKFNGWANRIITGRLMDGVRIHFGRKGYWHTKVRLVPFSRFKRPTRYFNLFSNSQMFLDFQTDPLLEDFLAKMAGDVIGRTFYGWVVKGKTHLELAGEYGVKECTISLRCKRAVERLRQKDKETLKALGFDAA